MNRRDFQALARTRLRDARVLLAAGQDDGAYYLLGLAVECGFEACIFRSVPLHQFSDKEFTRDCYQHHLHELVKPAGLEAALGADIAADPRFGANWLIVQRWSIEARYTPSGANAATLNEAVNNRYHGVMRWIRQRW